MELDPSSLLFISASLLPPTSPWRSLLLQSLNHTTSTAFTLNVPLSVSGDAVFSHMSATDWFMIHHLVATSAVYLLPLSFEVGDDSLSQPRHWFWGKQFPLQWLGELRGTDPAPHNNAVFGHTIDMLNAEFLSPPRCVFLHVGESSGAVQGAETLKTPTLNIRIIAHRIHPLSNPLRVWDLSPRRSRIAFTAFFPSFLHPSLSSNSAANYPRYIPKHDETQKHHHHSGWHLRDTSRHPPRTFSQITNICCFNAQKKSIQVKKQEL